MTTVKEVLDNLSPEQHKQIMHAFNHEWSYFVEYEPGRFIGVNTDRDVRVVSEQKVGVWRLGRLK